MRTSVVPPTFRARARSAAEPAAKLFGRVGLTPNMLTLIGFAISVVGAVLAAGQVWVLAGLVVGFGAIFDMFDGALARATNRTSRLGAFLDSTFDRLGEAAVYLGITFAFLRYEQTFTGFVAVLAMAAAFMVSYTRAKSESLGFTPGTGMANVGFMPREVRMVVLVIGLLAAPFTLLGGGRSDLPLPVPAIPASLFFALALIAVFAALTTFQRIVHVYLQAKKETHE